jgi:acyl-ACP thioesterase
MAGGRRRSGADHAVAQPVADPRTGAVRFHTRVDFMEIVPLPPSGRIFEQQVRVGLADAAPSGRARMDAIARWVQDLAYADIEDAGVAEDSAWVVRRMRVRVERFPRFGERMRAVTFCSGFSRLWAERRTRFEGDGGVVDVAGLWVHLNPTTLRPVPLPDSFDNLYAPAAQGRSVKARLRHPGPPEGAQQTPWRFRASDADIADHVNNAAYWAPLEEELAAAGGELRALDAEIEFRDPAQPGDAVILRRDSALWVAAPSGQLHASVVFRGSRGG